MFSDTDVNQFVKDNVRGISMMTEEGPRDIPLNMLTSSAENQYNKITVARLDNFYDAYNKGLKPHEGLGVGTDKAIGRAFKYQSDFYEYYHPTISPGMKMESQLRAELRAKGLSAGDIRKN